MSTDLIRFKVVKIDRMRSGKSGSGKSSAQSLLLRFFDVSTAVNYRYEVLTYISAAARCGTYYL